MMTYNELINEYNCEVMSSPNHMDGSIQISFRFPNNYCCVYVITLNELNTHSSKYIESSVCAWALSNYHTQLCRVLPTSYTSNELDKKLAVTWEPSNFVNKSNIGECYTVSFDISGGQDISVASVFRAHGDWVELVKTFTGAEAEWLYAKFTK